MEKTYKKSLTNNNCDLLNGPIFKSLIIFAIPLFISNVFQQLYNMADTMIVGYFLGDNALASIGATAAINELLIGFGLGIGNGLAVVTARSFGSGNEKMLKKSVAGSIIIGIISSIVITMLGSLILLPLLNILKTPYEIITMAYEYIAIIVWFTIVMFAYNLCAGLLRAIGDSVMPLVFLIISSVVNVILDIVFIAYFSMGVNGAAIATVLGQVVSAITGLLLNHYKNKEIDLKLVNFKPIGTIINRILIVAIPSIIMASIGSVMTFCMNKILMALTSTAVAVFGIYFKLQSFIFMPIFGLNNGMVPIIAYNFGAKKKERIVTTIKLSMLYAVVIMLFGFLAMQIIPKQLLLMFDASDNMISIGIVALRTISISFIFAGFCIVASSVYQAFGNGLYSMFVSIARQLIVLIPVAYVLSLANNVNIVWLSFPIAELVSVVLCSIYLRKIYNKHIDTL